MNLRFRLNLTISVIFTLALALGGILVIHNAKQAVADELQSTPRLASQLIRLALANFDSSPTAHTQLLERIGALETTRHLTIEVRSPEGALRFENPLAHDQDLSAPDWFIRLVAPEPAEYIYPIGQDGDGYIVLRTDPSAETAEAWEEAQDVLVLMLLFSTLINSMVSYMSGRALRPLERLRAGLDSIEQGDYGQRLPAFSLPEFACISRKFNSMAERLERSTEQNRYLAKRSLAIQEEERRHLARELHDELGQCLNAIKADAVSISRRCREQFPEILESADAIIAVSNHVHDVVRSMMRRLRPAMLDELGLVTTLQETIHDWSAHHPDSPCRLIVQGELDNLGEEISITVYRTVQEGLTNVAKYAQASAVEVRLEEVSENGNGVSLRLIVQDNGVGFDPEMPPHGLGLLGITERIQALMGTLRITSRRGEGTCLQVELPLTMQTRV